VSEFVVELETMKPGEFGSQVHLFVDDNGTREIVLSVSGVTAAPAKR
jgi:hypothetical protein